MSIANLRKLAEQFSEEGFLVLENSLSAEQLEALNRGVDQHLAEHSENWFSLGDAFLQAVDVLSLTNAFDLTIENPITLEVLRSLIGEQITLEEFSILIRNPSQARQDVKSWHRDIIRDFDRRMEIEAVSLIYYLTDVTESDHCFTIIPGTHNRLLDLRPEEIREGMETELYGPAGTAIIFHARCIHAGKLKPHSRQRRTLHLYFARSDQSRTSEWSEIPDRLRQKRDPRLPPLLYSKWKMRQVIEGTGKKPTDVGPGFSAVELLKIVQERAQKNR